MFNDVFNQTKNDSDTFLLYFEFSVKKSGRRLSDCFKQALEKCQPIKTMIEQQINTEFPIKTLQDKVVEKEKIVVSKKKAKWEKILINFICLVINLLISLKKFINIIDL